MVYQVCKEVNVPVVGLGGITCGEDVIEFMMAGATAVQIGTANFMNPLAGKNIVMETEEFLKKNGIKDIKEIIGAAQR